MLDTQQSTILELGHYRHVTHEWPYVSTLNFESNKTRRDKYVLGRTLMTMTSTVRVMVMMITTLAMMVPTVPRPRKHPWRFLKLRMRRR